SGSAEGRNSIAMDDARVIRPRSAPDARMYRMPRHGRDQPRVVQYLIAGHTNVPEVPPLREGRSRSRMLRVPRLPRLEQREKERRQVYDLLDSSMRLATSAVHPV